MDDPERRRAWLAGIAARVPRLFDSIAEGNVEAGYVLGEKRIGDRRVELALVARVVRGAVRQSDTWDAPPPLPSPRNIDRAGVSDVDARDDLEVSDRPPGPRRKPRRGGPII